MSDGTFTGVALLVIGLLIAAVIFFINMVDNASERATRRQCARLAFQSELPTKVLDRDCYLRVNDRWVEVS